MYPKYWYLLFAIILLSCRKEPQGADLTGIPFQPQPYSLQIPYGFSTPLIPDDNPMTAEGVSLGRYLFYDPILSVSQALSCAGCHRPERAFSGDPLVTGAHIRSAPSLLNCAFISKGYFADGRDSVLEKAIESHLKDPDCMLFDPIADRIRSNTDYQSRYRKAFGIANRNQIDLDKTAKALAQFLRTLISADSKYDKIASQPGVFFEETPLGDEYNGYAMYFELPFYKDAKCSHCHAGALMGDRGFFNNGLQEAATQDDYPDKARGSITGKPADNGKFHAPSLRNLAYSAPYMHDGRFQTLQEVLDFYRTGGHPSPNRDPWMLNLQQAQLSDQEKKDIIAFLLTLTDSTFVNNTAYQSPF